MASSFEETNQKAESVGRSHSKSKLISEVTILKYLYSFLSLLFGHLIFTSDNINKLQHPLFCLNLRNLIID